MRCGLTMRMGRKASLGFTSTDLLAIMAVATVLAALMMARGNLAKQKAARVGCAANLQQVNRAVLSYCTEHNDKLPENVPGQAGALWWWYKELVKPYAGLTGPSSANDKVFACPMDRGYSDPVPFHANGRFDYGSYVYNGVTLPGMPNIAGLRTSDIKQPKRTLLVMEWTAHAPLSWHNSKTGRKNMPFYRDAQSLVGFVDGHVNFSRIYYDGYNAAYTRDPIAGYDYQYSGK